MKPNRYLQFAALFVGFAFLYIPIISLIVYSFNESKLVTVWGGFSTKWYGVLFQDHQMLDGLVRPRVIVALAGIRMFAAATPKTAEIRIVDVPPKGRRTPPCRRTGDGRRPVRGLQEATEAERGI